VAAVVAAAAAAAVVVAAVAASVAAVVAAAVAAAAHYCTSGAFPARALRSASASRPSPSGLPCGRRALRLLNDEEALFRLAPSAVSGFTASYPPYRLPILLRILLR